MPNFIDMQTRIASEVRFASTAAASGIQPQIKNAINDAIEFYDQKRFEFNEGIWEPASGSLEAGRSVYPLPEEFLLIDSFRITLQGGSYYTLTPKTWTWIERTETHPGRLGYPVHYAMYGKQFRLYPIPQYDHPCRVAGVTKLDPQPLVADTDENAWTNEAEQLIRAHAKALLYEDMLHMPEKAQRQAAKATLHLSELEEHARSFISTGLVQASW